jgi:hypothetical protein
MEKIMKKFFTAALLSLGVLAATVSTSSAAGVKAGTLSCHVDSGWGLLIGSSKKADCVFTHSDGTKTKYKANITKIGVDVGYTSNKNIAWVVMSLHGEGADLSGTYIGANAEATVGVGLGANALVGGLNRNFALQPLSVQGQTGLNVAAGVAALTLSK